MTENEAKQKLDSLHYKIVHTSFCNKVYESEIESLCMAKDILEEIKAYRAIGTVEEFKALKEAPMTEDELKEFEMLSDIVEQLQKLEEYKHIGTLEECRVAVERMKPKKVADDGAFGRCPVCDYEFNSELRDEYNISVCLGCFQVLDWSN